MAEPFLPPIRTPISLTVSTQNCNSLNLTTNVRSYELKIAAIKNLNTDVICLCDTRLVSSKGISGTLLGTQKGKNMMYLQTQHPIAGELQF